MKKLLFTLAGALAVTANLSAQITLNQSSYNASNIGVDSVKVTTYNSTYPNLHAAANGMWDMAVVTDTTPVYLNYRVASNDTTQFADSNHYLFSSLIYNANIQSSVLANGIVEYSQHIPHQVYTPPSIPALVDSVVILAQDASYSSPRVKISFPATYNSTWMSNYQYNLNFRITAPAISLNQTLSYVKAMVSEYDTVTGWGQMRVKDVNGNPSGWMNVLQVKSATYITDSFYIGGALANPAILQQFQVTQGQIDTTYQQNYYRPMELTPLANVQFNDAGDNAPYAATTHAQRLAYNSVNNVKAGNINVYPNPVINYTVSLDLPAGKTDWSYELINVSGQSVSKDVLTVIGTHSTLALSPSVVPGIYYIRLTNATGDILIKPLDIIK